MFDLEEQIVAWRKQLIAAGIKAKPSLNELENHLREHVAAQIKSGSSESQAFEFAIEKLGPIPTLAREFKKVAAAKHLQRRKLMSIVTSIIVGLCVAGITARLFAEDITTEQRWFCFAALMTMLVLFVCLWRFVPRFAPIIRNQAAQSAVGVLGGISGVVWFVLFVRVIVPRHEFMPGELLAAILWAMIPLVLLPTASFLIADKSEYHHLTTDS
jgi:uncharacterized membrane protein